MRRGELLFNTFFLHLPAVVIVMVVLIQFWLFSPVATILCTAGFVLFFKAKWSVLKTGKLFTFGPSVLSDIDKKFYLTGYALMVAGVVIAIFQKYFA